MIEVRWHGRRRQGASAAARTLAAGLLRTGRWAQTFPVAGVVRTGPVTVCTRAGGVAERQSLRSGRTDVVAVLDGTLVEPGTTAGLTPEGLLVVNAANRAEVRERAGWQGRLLCVDADRLAEAAGSRVPTLVVLGGVAAALGAPPIGVLAGLLRRSTIGRSATALEAGKLALEVGWHLGVTQVAGPKSAAVTQRAAPPLPGVAALAVGGAILAWGGERKRDEAPARRRWTPRLQRGRCTACLACWALCPDDAVRTDRAQVLGFDDQACRGCALCAEVCPGGAITMVPHELPAQLQGRVGG
jgi:2-oxoacid:acceptor oxidoreductase delta subunit (pyruvate/2-ketoisovalerate family)